MNQSTSFAQVATNQFDYLSSALCANTPPCKKHSSSRKFLTLSISLRLWLVMFLTLTVTTNAWGGAGFWDNDGITLTFTVNSSSVTRTLNVASQGGETSLGTVTTAITLNSVQANVWKDGGNICSVNMFYQVKNSSETVVLDKSSTSTSLGYYSAENKNQVWQNTNVDVDLMNGGLAPGTYTFECWFSATGSYNNGDKCDETFWYSNKDGSNYKYTFIIPSKKLTVSGAANGNTVSGTVTGITKGKAYTITATPTAGYSFSQWTASSGASSITIANANNASTTVTFKNYLSDATVTASFKPNTYTVTLDNQGATTAGQASVTATYNAAMPSIANNLPKKTGYTFNGYFDAPSGGTQYYKADGTSAKNWNKTAATTLYAQWTLNTYPVKWFVNGEELTDAATTVAHGSKITTIPEVDLNTYCEGSDVLAGWIAAPMENASVAAPANLYKTIEDFPTVEGPQTYYAVFANYVE